MDDIQTQTQDWHVICKLHLICYPRKHLGNLENSEYQVSYHGLFKTRCIDI